MKPPRPLYYTHFIEASKFLKNERQRYEKTVTKNSTYFEEFKISTTLFERWQIWTV